MKFTEVKNLLISYYGEGFLSLTRVYFCGDTKLHLFKHDEDYLSPICGEKNTFPPGPFGYFLDDLPEHKICVACLDVKASADFWDNAFSVKNVCSLIKEDSTPVEKLFDLSLYNYDEIVSWLKTLSRSNVKRYEVVSNWFKTYEVTFQAKLNEFQQSVSLTPSDVHTIVLQTVLNENYSNKILSAYLRNIFNFYNDAVTFDFLCSEKTLVEFRPVNYSEEEILAELKLLKPVFDKRLVEALHSVNVNSCMVSKLSKHVMRSTYSNEGFYFFLQRDLYAKIFTKCSYAVKGKIMFFHCPSFVAAWVASFTQVKILEVINIKEDVLKEAFILNDTFESFAEAYLVASTI